MIKNYQLFQDVYRIFIGLLLLSLTGCLHQKSRYPQRKDIVETVYASGKILADSEYTVYALSPGTISCKLIHPGDRIQAGQALYLLKNEVPAANQRAAEADLRHTQENLTGGTGLLNELKTAMDNAAVKYSNDSLTLSRYRNLWAQNIGTKVNLDLWQTNCQLSLNAKTAAQLRYQQTLAELKVNLKKSESQVAGSRAELDHFTIRAAGQGMIYQTYKEAGEAVRPNEPVALLGSSGRYIIRLDVDQQDITKLKIGQSVLLKTDISGERIWKSRVERIYPMMNEADQTFRVDAVFSGPQPGNFIHCSVEANILISSKQHSLVIPANYIVAGNQVMIRQDGQRKLVKVKIGIRTPDQAEILSGLDERSELIEPDTTKP